MSWRILITDDPYVWGGDSWADWVIFGLWDVPAVAKEAQWMAPQKIYTPRLDDVRFEALIRCWIDGRYYDAAEPAVYVWRHRRWVWVDEALVPCMQGLFEVERRRTTFPQGISLEVTPSGERVVRSHSGE